MIVQAAPFVPYFLLGIFFLLGPSLVLTLFTNSDHVGMVVALATAIAALVRPQASWMLFMVLCTLRTVPFLAAFLVAIFLRIGVAGVGGWVLMRSC